MSSDDPSREQDAPPEREAPATPTVPEETPNLPEPVAPPSPEPQEEPAETEVPLPKWPDVVRRGVWGKIEREVLLNELAALSVSDLTDLYRRWKIVFALNGIAPEFQTMTARQRRQIIDRIIEAEDHALSS